VDSILDDDVRAAVEDKGVNPVAITEEDGEEAVPELVGMRVVALLSTGLELSLTALEVAERDVWVGAGPLPPVYPKDVEES